MTQRRRHSLIEVISSTAFGFAVSYWLNWLILPAFGHPVSHSDNFWIVVIFTVASLIRSYLFRRIFNRLTKETK